MPRIVLVDTFKDEAEEALRVAHALGDRLYGIRLDTPSERGRVTADLVHEIRARLDQAGFEHVQITVSGGLNPERIAYFKEAGAPVDSYAVGSYISGATPDRLHRRHQGDRRAPDRQARPHPGPDRLAAPPAGRPVGLSRGLTARWCPDGAPGGVPPRVRRRPGRRDRRGVRRTPNPGSSKQAERLSRTWAPPTVAGWPGGVAVGPPPSQLGRRRRSCGPRRRSWAGDVARIDLVLGRFRGRVRRASRWTMHVSWPPRCGRWFGLVRTMSKSRGTEHRHRPRHAPEAPARRSVRPSDGWSHRCPDEPRRRRRPRVRLRAVPARPRPARTAPLRPGGDRARAGQSGRAGQGLDPGSARAGVLQLGPGRAGARYLRGAPRDRSVVPLRALRDRPVPEALGQVDRARTHLRLAVALSPEIRSTAGPSARLPPAPPGRTRRRRRPRTRRTLGLGGPRLARKPEQPDERLGIGDLAALGGGQRVVAMAAARGAGARPRRGPSRCPSASRRFVAR